MSSGDIPEHWPNRGSSIWTPQVIEANRLRSTGLDVPCTIALVDNGKEGDPDGSGG
jgi:hypothetical protein